MPKIRNRPIFDHRNPLDFTRFHQIPVDFQQSLITEIAGNQHLANELLSPVIEI